MSYFSREYIWTNHWFSGDMLVFSGVNKHLRNIADFSIHRTCKSKIMDIIGRCTMYIFCASNLSLRIQSPSQMVIGVYNHLLRKVFRFQYHSQKVIGSIGCWYMFHFGTQYRKLIHFHMATISISTGATFPSFQFINGITNRKPYVLSIGCGFSKVRPLPIINGGYKL